MTDVADVKARVLEMLTEGLGIEVQLRPENEVLVELPESSTAVFIRFFAKEFKSEEIEDQVFVNVSAPLLRGLSLTPELYRWVATEGTTYDVGCVQLYEVDEDDGSQTGFLRFVYTLLGDYLDEDELGTALWTVLFTADRLDDELQAQFGGRRWVDEDPGDEANL
jgi:hypothetical protein